MKIASYKCDSCGSLINDPHEVKMREFTFTRANDGGCYRFIKIVQPKKIHLCDVCFHGLNKIANDSA